MLLANSNIDSNQMISILAAATTNNTVDTTTLSNQDLIEKVKYDSVASILRQCDKEKTSSTIAHSVLLMSNFTERKSTRLKNQLR